MKRLDFTLHDFCRVSWASAEARSRWANSLDHSRALLGRLELETVRIGMRKVGLIAVNATGREEFIDVCANAGLKFAALYSMSPKAKYVSEYNSAHSGSQLTVFAVGSYVDVTDATHAFKRNQTDLLGQLLGYPECCINFFNRVWNQDRHIDTTWPMAVASAIGHRPSDLVYEAHVRPQNNLLLRWVGLRPVFHLPCSFECTGTFEVANKIKEVALGNNELAALSTLYEILEWPVQWSALHGIAEIETPVFRISTRTDSTADKYSVRLLGRAGSVVGAPFGNRFPYAARERKAVRPEPAIALPQPTPEIIAIDDKLEIHKGFGFRSNIEMLRALEPIVKVALANEPRSILHVACKNGALLRRLADTGSALELYGIDGDSANIECAKKVLPSSAAKLWTRAFSDDAFLKELPSVDVCIIMLGRLLDLSMDQAQEVLRVLREKTPKMVVYAFDDWLSRRSLVDMASELGISIVEVTGGVAIVAAENPFQIMPPSW